jgi:hypothetical protein
MSSPEDRDTEPFGWLSRCFASGGVRSGRIRRGFFGFPDIFIPFDGIRREMESSFFAFRYVTRYKSSISASSAVVVGQIFATVIVSQAFAVDSSKITTKQINTRKWNFNKHKSKNRFSLKKRSTTCLTT